MSATYSQAIDEIFLQFKTAWDLGAAAIAGYVPEIFFQNVEKPNKPLKNVFWCRLSTQAVIEEQASLSACVETPGVRRYENTGLLFIQLFCPKSEATAAQNGRLLAELAKNAYRGKTTASRIIFRNFTIKELKPEENWYRYNVVGTYEFDDIG